MEWADVAFPTWISVGALAVYSRGRTILAREEIGRKGLRRNRRLARLF